MVHHEKWPDAGTAAVGRADAKFFIDLQEPGHGTSNRFEIAKRHSSPQGMGEPGEKLTNEDMHGVH